MTNKTTKATIVPVNYAGFEFQGLVLPNGDRCLGVPLIADLFGAHKNYASQEFKRLLGNGFRPHKITTEIGNQKVNVIDLVTFKKLVRALDKAGNEVANRLAEAAIELSIDIAFDAAMGVEKTTRDYKAEYDALVRSKATRRELTDILQECYLETGEYPCYGKHTLGIYESIGLLDKYNEYKALYPTPSKRSKTPFRHSYISEQERAIITRAESKISTYVEDFDMCVDEAVLKLKQVMEDKRN